MATEKNPLCEEVKDELARVLDGTAASELYDHIAECDACRDLRHDAARAPEWVRRAGADFVASAGLDDRVLAALDARGSTTPSGAAPPRAPAQEVVTDAGTSTPEERGPADDSAASPPAQAKEVAAPAPAPPKAPASDVGGPSLRRGGFVVLALVAAAAAAVVVGKRGVKEPGAAKASAAPWAGSLASVARAAGGGGDGVVRCDEAGKTCAPLGPSAAIPRGSLVRTDDRTRAELKLDDGTTLVLDRSSELVLHAAADRSATLSRGAVVADVSHVSGDAKAELRVPTGRVEVLGTKLSLFAAPDRARVDVARGVVRIFDASSKSELVYAGEEGRLEKGKAPVVSPSSTVAESFAWSERGLKKTKLAADADEPLRGLGELRAKKPGTKEERDAAVRLVRHDVKVRISDSVARTEIDETFENSTGEELEGIFRFPLPPDAQIERLALEVNGKLEEGAFVEKEKAAAIWRGVIQNAAPKAPKPVEEIIWVPGPWRDPALLEWKRGGRFELRIFPIPARGARRVVLAYTQAVPQVGGLRRYTYPLPYDAKGSTTVDSFRLDAQIVGNDKGAGVRTRGYEAAKVEGDRVELSGSKFTPSGDLVLEYALPSASSEVSAYAYQPAVDDGGGAFAMIQLRPKLPRARNDAPHDHVIVVDTSRSMVGERLARAKAVATEMVRELDGRDRVSVMACDTTCRAWSLGMADPGARAADAADAFFAGVVADGSTDLLASAKAARAALGERAGARRGSVVYVGDGGASAGPTKPDHLTAEITRALGGDAKLTAIAVGADADATLLAAMARGGGGTLVPFVPGQRASGVALSALSAAYGVALEQPELVLPAGFVAVAPARLDSIRAGAEATIVARMTSREIEGEAVLRGKVGGQTFEQKYPLKVVASSDAGNAFVPRQYAALRIADLERESGSEVKAQMVELSKRYAVASRHTSLLVLESEAMMTAFGLQRSVGVPRWTGEQAATATQAEGQTAVESGADEEKKEDSDGKAKDSLGMGSLGLTGAGEAAGGARRAEAEAPAQAAPAGRAAGPRGMDDGFAQAPPAKAAAAPPPVMADKPMPTVAAPFEPRDDPRSRRMPPGMPPRRLVPMKKVWDRKGSVSLDPSAARAREASKLVAAESALSARPDSKTATRDLFGLYAQHGQLDRASEVAERWASRDALDPEALVARADLAARRGDRELALRILGGVVDVRPDDAAAQGRIAHLYELAGQRAKGCAHRVALAEQLAGDLPAQAAALRCARAEGMSELGARLLADVAADKRAGVEAAAAKEPPAVDALLGDVRLEATWDSDVDLDLGLVDKLGQRLSWLGGGKARTTARGVTQGRSESLAISNLGSGGYVIEVVRATPGAEPVRGQLTVRAVGETRVIPFTLTEGRLELGRIEVFYTSRLVPVGGLPRRPGVEREQQRERRERRPIALDAHAAAVALHDLAHDRQPEARALALGLRREERLEHAGQIERRDAVSVVRDGEREVGVARLHRQRELAADLRQGVRRVRQEVHDRLGELGGGRAQGR